MHRSGKKSNVFGHVICLVAAVVMSAAAWMNTRTFLPAEMDSYYYDDYQMPEQLVSVYKPTEKGKKKSSIGKIRKADDIKESQMYLDFREGKEQKFLGVIVKLKDSFPYDMKCTLYYQNRAGRLDHNCKTTTKLPQGEKTIYFSLPEDRYYDMTGIRVDFEEDYAKYLEEVLVCKNQIVGKYRAQEQDSEHSILICFLSVLILMELIRFLSPEIRRAFPGFQTMIKKWGKFFLLSVVVVVNTAIVGELILQFSSKSYGRYQAGLLVIAAVAVAIECVLLIQKLPELEDKPVDRHAPPLTWRELLPKLLYWLLLTGLGVQIYLAFRDGYYEKWAELEGVYIWTPFAVLLIQVLLLGLLFRKFVLIREENRISFDKVFLFLFFVMGFCYVMLFLPFASADEPDHFLSAYRVSNLFMGQIGQLGDARLLMRLEDYLFFTNRKETLSADYYKQIAENLHYFRQEAGYVIADGPMVTNALFSYLPAGAGIAIARLLRLSDVMTFWAGRFGNLLFCTAMLGKVMKKIPFGETAVFAMAMFPMALHTVGSFSYDGPTLCFVLLFVAHVMQMAYSEERIRNRDYLFCVFYGILLAPSKLVYLPLLMLVYLVPSKTLSSSERRAFWRKCLVVVAGMLAVILIMSAVNLLGADSAIGKMVRDNASVHLVKWGKHEEGYTISWILYHPLKYLVMCLRTFVKMADYFLFTMAGTQLGWLNIYLPYAPAAISLFVFVLAVNIREKDDSERTPDIEEKSWIFLLCIGSAMIIFLAMALDWTPLSDNYISGIQGRYFLPLLGPAIWMLRTPMIRVQSSMRRYIVFYEGAINILLLVHVFTRYMIST